MRIAFLNTRSDAVGGTQVHVADLAAEWVRMGDEVLAIVGGTGPGVDILTDRGIRTLQLSNLVQTPDLSRDIVVLTQIRSALRRFRPDIVSAHTSKAGLIGRLAAFSLGIPCIFTAHGWSFAERTPLRQRYMGIGVERVLGPRTSRIITVSESDRNLALDLKISSSTKIITIHNGMRDIQGQFRAQPGKCPPEIVMVARFEPQKNHAELLRALAQLTDIPWSLKFVGSGPLEFEARALCKALAIGDRVQFTGPLRDVVPTLARSQLFVLSSNWEGLPRSIIEAMRAGLPVVASNVGGTSEQVHDGISGFLTPPGDVNALAAALSTLLTSPRLRESMGEAARRQYEQNFTFDRMASTTYRVYMDVVGAARSGGREAKQGRIGPQLSGSMQKLKIVHVVERYEGGTGDFISDLTRCTPEFDHVVIRGKGADTTQAQGDCSSTNARLIEWPGVCRNPRPLRDAVALAKLVQRLQGIRTIGVLHLHSAKAGFHGRLAARLCGLTHRVVYTTHASPIFRLDIGRAERALYRLLERLASRLGGEVIACSPSERTALRRAFIPATAIANGVEVPEHPPVACPARTIRVGTMGRITAQKDPHTFRDIADAFVGRPDVEFVWIGDGELREALRGPNIRVTGWLSRADAVTALRSVDVYVSTSKWEGLSLSALQAMAGAKPVVMRRCVGNVDLVEAPTNGHLFDTASEACAAIALLIEDRALLFRMGEASRAIASEKFGMQRMVDSYRELYSRVGRARHSPRR